MASLAPSRKISRTCPSCRNIFETFPSQNCRYCSITCAWAARWLTLADRFWAKVDKNGPIIRPELGPCYIWTGCLFPNGYPQIRVNAKTCLATHVRWEMEYGEPLSDGQYALHKCDNKPCVRLEHLFSGTHDDNMADKSAKGRCYQGEHHNLAKLTEVGVREMRILAASGMSCRELGRRFGVTGTNVSDVVRRVTWKHIT